MSASRLETPPLETLGTPPAVDDARSSALAILMASPEVEVIGRMLANIQRKRLGLRSILRLDTLEPEETQHFRERAVMAIRSLDVDHVESAIHDAAKIYGIKTYGDGFDSMNSSRQAFCVHAARAVCMMFRQSLSGL